MTSGVKRALVTAVKLAVVAGAVTYVLVSGKVDLSRIAGAGDFRLILAGWAVLLLVPVVTWLRWWLIMRAQGMQVGLHETLKITLIGLFFNTFLVGTTGGDVVKAYYIASGAGRGRKAAAVTTVFMDRLYGVVGLVAVIASAAFLVWDDVVSDPLLRWIAAAFATAYGSLLAVLAFLLVPQLREGRRRWLGRRSRGRWARIARALDEVDEALQTAVRYPGTSLLCIAVSVLGHLATAVSFYFFAVALGETGIPLGKFLVLAPLALGLTAIPVFPAGGAGFGETFASIVFKSAAGSAEWLGGNVLVLWRVGLFITGPVGLVYFLMARKDIERARAEA